MAPRSRPELLKHKRFLARLIATAWENGQRAEPMKQNQEIRRWTADTLADAVGSNIRAVQGWRDEKRPQRPLGIMPLLRVFYGDRPEHLAARQTMLEAWRRAGGIPDIDLTPVDSSGNCQAEAAASLQGFTGGPKPIHPDIHSIGDLFTGRDDFLVRLRASLTRQSAGVSAIRALNGMAGIGKTQATMEYALRYQDEYTALLFVRAYDEATLDRELAALTGVLRLPERETADVNVRKDAVLRWLRAHSGWLLILDNVDTPEALRAATDLGRSLRSGHVLLTSRLERAFAQDIETLELGLLTPGDAVLYLMRATEGRRQPEGDAEAWAGALAEALNRLPSVLHGASVIISQRRVTFSRYLAELTLEATRGVDPILDAAISTGIGHLSEQTRTMIERLSFFTNDPIPEFLFEVYPFGATPLEGQLVAFNLQQNSFIGRPSPVHSTTIVDPAVRDLAYARLAADPERHFTRLNEVLIWLNAAFDGNPLDPGTWPNLERLAPHAEAVAVAADKAGIAEPTGRLMSAVGTLFQSRNQPQRAEPLLGRALALLEASRGRQHPSVATGLIQLAQVVQSNRGPEEAVPLIRRALAINEASFGPNHMNVAIVLNNLVELLHETSRMDEAERLARRLLVICLIPQGVESGPHPLHDTAIQNYRLVLARLGRTNAEISTEISRAKLEASLLNPPMDAAYNQSLPSDPIPVQVAGPHFAVSVTSRIAQAPPSSIDADGNDTRRIRQLLPLVRDAVNDLAAGLKPNDNAYPELARDVTYYRGALSNAEPEIAWGLVWGLGVRLEEAAAAAERKIGDQLAPPLEDSTLAALQSLRSLHAPLILATTAGRELQEQSDRLRMTREEQAALREDAVALSITLQQDQEIIESEAAAIIVQAAAAIGEGRHPERGTIFGIATIKHTSIVLISAAIIAAPASLIGGVFGVGLTMAAWEAIKKSPIFAAATAGLGEDFNKVLEVGGAAAQNRLAKLAPFRRFVRANEQQLRRIAMNTRQLQWMLPYIDFIVKTDGFQNETE
ncbi:MAG: tetratricopeptide repeat protein [Acetobacteraceae bacterium]|nr:tetratricopeptide repeat protein [Acetobacteraceae bacterium]